MKKTIIKVIPIFIFISSLFISCIENKHTVTKAKSDGNTTENEKDTFIYNVISDDPSVTISPEYSAAINTFSVDLLSEIYSDFIGKNLVISPFCLSRNLAVLTEGTTGDSKHELLDVIGGQCALDDASDALSELLYADDSVLLQIADAFWFDSRYYTLQEGFRNLINSKYGVEISGLDFGNQIQAADDINNWISTNTSEMIPSMITYEQILEAAFFITSTIYFKADWTSPFDITLTTEYTFYSPDGDVQTDMMKSNYNHKTYRNNSYENAKIYYGTDSTDFFYLDIFMPVDTSIEDFLKNECLTALASQQEYDTGVLTMPGFEFETEVDLIAVLESLGVAGIFDQGKGDITGIFNETNQIYISKIYQKSGIKADEEGTVAYSATVSEGGAGASPSLDIVLDHPFIFFIRAGQNGLVLFAGVVNNPNNK